jgi:hypothetical protein
MKKPAPLKKDDALATLRSDNPAASEQDMGIYVDLFFEYHQAQRLVDRIGPITADPTTKMPMANPYVRVRDAAAEKMRSFRSLRADALWRSAWRIEAKEAKE